MVEIDWTKILGFFKIIVYQKQNQNVYLPEFEQLFVIIVPFVPEEMGMG